MEQDRQINSIISNLEMISHKSNELINDRYNTYSYDDFYTYYTSYISYLKSIQWENNEVDEIIHGFPKIDKPKTVFYIMLLSVLTALLTLFTFYIMFYIIPPLIYLGIIIFIRNKRKSYLKEVKWFCERLKNKLRVEYLGQPI